MHLNLLAPRLLNGNSVTTPLLLNEGSEGGENLLLNAAITSTTAAAMDPLTAGSGGRDSVANFKWSCGRSGSVCGRDGSGGKFLLRILFCGGSVSVCGRDGFRFFVPHTSAVSLYTSVVFRFDELDEAIVGGNLIKL